MSDANHWRNIGAGAAKRSWSVTTALTGKPAVDALILEGYKREIDRQRRQVAKIGK